MSRNAGLSLSSARPPALATRAAWRMVRAEESVTDHVREEHEGTQATHARGACHSTSSFSRAERWSQRSRAPAPVHILIGVARCRCPQSELRPTRNTIGPRPKPFNTCKKVRRKVGSETARHLCSSGRGPRSTVASAPPPCARPSTGEPEAPSIRGRAQLPAVAPLLAAPAAALGGGRRRSRTDQGRGEHRGVPSRRPCAARLGLSTHTHVCTHRIMPPGAHKALRGAGMRAGEGCIREAREGRRSSRERRGRAAAFLRVRAARGRDRGGRHHSQHLVWPVAASHTEAHEPAEARRTEHAAERRAQQLRAARARHRARRGAARRIRAPPHRAAHAPRGGGGGARAAPRAPRLCVRLSASMLPQIAQKQSLPPRERRCNASRDPHGGLPSRMHTAVRRTCKCAGDYAGGNALDAQRAGGKRRGGACTGSAEATSAVQ